MSDALLAVVMEAREDLGVVEVLLTNGTVPRKPLFWVYNDRFAK